MTREEESNEPPRLPHRQPCEICGATHDPVLELATQALRLRRLLQQMVDVLQDVVPQGTVFFRAGTPRIPSSSLPVR